MRVRLIGSIVATQCAVSLVVLSAGCAGSHLPHQEDEAIEAHERVPPLPQRVLEAFRRDYPGLSAWDTDHQFTGFGPVVYRFRFIGRDGRPDEAFYYYSGRRATAEVWRREDERPRETPIPDLVP